MAASLCSVIGSITGSAVPPTGGGPGDVASADSVVWQVTAELRGTDFVANDGGGLVDQVFVGEVAPLQVVTSGYLTGYRDLVSYTLRVPFIDQLLIGVTPQMPPYSLYYLVTEQYITNTGFGTLLTYGQPANTTPYTITKKIRPLSAGGSIQAIDSILI